MHFGPEILVSRYLLDTHCWLWMQVTPDLLEDSVRSALVDPGNELFLSAASTWEIAIKYRLGKLALPEPPSEYVPPRLVSGFVTPLDVRVADTLRVATLPDHHRDPFDRLLVAQSQRERLPIVTADRMLTAYDVEIVWAARGGVPPR